jgi:hypothetical protein
MEGMENWKSWNGKTGMANDPPPYRASSRPLAGLLGGLTAACAPVVMVTQLEKRSSTR